MARLRHLVVVVPGIGGSILQTPRGAVEWNQSRRRLAAALTRPDRLDLDRAPDLVPVDLLPDITLIGPYVLPGYDRLVRQIVNRFDDVRVDTARPDRAPDPYADLVLFPYDFRHSIRHAAERLGADVKARLDGELPGARRRRVIVVAHSMGGLVARYWLGPGGGAAHCEALITLGTPHRGAPKALDYLVNGIKVGPKRLTGLTRVLRGWPSAYELMPRYRAVGSSDGGATLYPRDLTGLPDLPGFAKAAEAAFEVHRDIEDAWRDLAGRAESPQLAAVFGRGHATPQRALLAGTAVTVTKRAAPWLPNPHWHGDGSVPAISAIPIEAEDDLNVRYPAPERHLALGSAPTVLDLLAEYTDEPLHAVRGEAMNRPWLGLDLDETLPFGHPVGLGITFNPGEASGEEAPRPEKPGEDTKVRVRLRPVGPGSTALTPTRWQDAVRNSDGVSWHAEIEPPPLGTHRVEVEATGVPGTGRLTAGDILGVVDLGAVDPGALDLADGTEPDA
ncbi:lipase/acyltransferase domain-containing protein [Kitasatospora sp. NBC_00458]|uniref:lipase/acyltransferase domain-containing protein n=1 Tax=Kitasatospora sp. NBC_00458 TaxID=2903568 RepID=UPI002E19B7DC